MAHGVVVKLGASARVTAMNISSVIVIPHPDHIAAVRARLQEVVGVEVHAVSPEGKTIVTIEADDDRATSRIFESLGQLDGVLSASMVYHQNESDPEMEISVEA
jgi:nitrate reductase NapD